MKGDIIRYRIMQDISTDPMYGKSKKLSPYYEDRDRAIRDAKFRAKRAGVNNVYVEKSIFASQRNFERDFALERIYDWSTWFDGLDDEVK